MIKLEAFRIKESEDRLCMIAWRIAEGLQGYRITQLLPNMTMICRICRFNQLMEVLDSLVVVLECNLPLLSQDTTMLQQWDKMLFKNSKICPFKISTWINQLVAHPMVYPVWEEVSKCRTEINQSISCKMQSNARSRNSPVKTSTFRRGSTHQANLETIIIWWWEISTTLRSVLSMALVLVVVRAPHPKGWVLCPKRSIAWMVSRCRQRMLSIKPVYWMILFLMVIRDRLLCLLQQQ